MVDLAWFCVAFTLAFSGEFKFFLQPLWRLISPDFRCGFFARAGAIFCWFASLFWHLFNIYFWVKSTPFFSFFWGEFPLSFYLKNLKILTPFFSFIYFKFCFFLLAFLMIFLKHFLIKKRRIFPPLLMDLFACFLSDQILELSYSSACQNSFSSSFNVFESAINCTPSQSFGRLFL